MENLKNRFFEYKEPIILALLFLCVFSVNSISMVNNIAISNNSLNDTFTGKQTINLNYPDDPREKFELFNNTVYSINYGPKITEYSFDQIFHNALSELIPIQTIHL